MAPGARNWMRICAIAHLRRSGSRFSGQNRPRSSEMRVYIGKTINSPRFWAVFGSILGGSGDDLGMIWACSGGFPGMF